VIITALARFARADGGLQDPAHPIPPAPPPPPSQPDPVVAASAQHGIESTSRHQGLSATLAIGGGLTVGVGIDSSVGRGPAGSLRIAHMAGERWAFTAEIANTTLLHRVKGTDSSSGDLRTDVGTNLLFGAQLYVNRVLWLRGGVGLGSFSIDEPDSMDTRILAGPSGVVGGGLDLVRFRRAAIGVEMMSIGMLNRDGLLTTTSFMVDLSVESIW
jgi:hypothetical protein